MPDEEQALRSSLITRRHARPRGAIFGREQSRRRMYDLLDREAISLLFQRWNTARSSAFLFALREMLRESEDESRKHFRTAKPGWLFCLQFVSA